MRAWVVAVMFVSLGLAGCADEGTPRTGPTTTNTTTSSAPTSTNTTTTAAPPPQACAVWVAGLQGKVLRAGGDGRHAAWNVLIGVEGVNVTGAIVSVETVQLDDGEPRSGTAQQDEETAASDGEVTFVRPTGSGRGSYRLTVMDIVQEGLEGPCVYDPGRNVATRADVTLTG